MKKHSDEASPIVMFCLVQKVLSYLYLVFSCIGSKLLYRGLWTSSQGVSGSINEIGHSNLTFLLTISFSILFGAQIFLLKKSQRPSMVFWSGIIIYYFHLSILYFMKDPSQSFYFSFFSWVSKIAN